MKKQRGHSMAELMVALAVFSVVVAVGSELLVHGLRSTAAGERRQTALDEGRNVLYRVSDELRQADAVLDPPRDRLLAEGSTYIVLSTPDGVIGYRLISVGTFWIPEWRVLRVKYVPGYTPGIPGTQIVDPGTARVLTSAPSSLRFSIDAEGGLPPGQGGTTTGQGTGLALALGTQKDTIQVELGITPYESETMKMRTKKTVWAGLFPSPGSNGNAVSAAP